MNLREPTINDLKKYINHGLLESTARNQINFAYFLTVNKSQQLMKKKSLNVDLNREHIYLYIADEGTT